MAIGKYIKLASLFALLICTGASCRSGHPLTEIPQLGKCGFSDPKFMTSLGIWYRVADYYVTNHEWPLTRKQLEEENQKILVENKKDMTSDEIKEFSEFLQQFTLLDLKTKGGDLIFHYRFNMNGETVDQTITLVPKSTVDEILASATDAHEN